MNIRAENVWQQVKMKDWPVHPGMRREIDFGFDKEIPEDDRERYRTFFAWAEEHFVFPITLWIDLRHRHYLLSRERKHVGYNIYFNPDIPLQDVTDEEDIPVADVPVRREKWHFDEIMYSLIECITEYHLRLLGRGDEDINDYSADTQEILSLYQAYLDEDDAYWD